MTYPYGLIGNARVSALCGADGSVDWLCLPRPDSPPVFGRLLDPEGGHFRIGPAEGPPGTQAYLPNTNVLETSFRLPDGSAYRILDFCPRFLQHGRTYRPASLFRIVEPLEGSPFVRVSVRPVDGWDRTPLTPRAGNSHLRFERGRDFLRLATNAPLTYLEEERPFGLKEPLFFALTWDEPLEADLAAVSRDFLARTVGYWRDWVRRCNVPARHQAETIRSALTLKLHCHEDTGAILAGVTTSLPEEPGGVRNWDYRYCWLRDAHFCLGAFRRLGQFEEMEGFLKFLLDLAHREEGRLRPVYRLDRSLPLPEREHPWAGWAGGRPVREGNQAAEHVQNDVYGEMVLTLCPLFLDERLRDLRHPDHERLLGLLAQRCDASIGQPDAGPWEIRGASRVHAFTQLMAWAGLDRAVALRRRGLLGGIDLDLEAARARAAAALESTARGGSLRASEGSDAADASLLLAPVLRYPMERLCSGTVDLIRRELKVGDGPEGFLYRYRTEDDFGQPRSAFVVCSFWLVQALARLDRLPEARAAMERALEAALPLGLLSEHYDPQRRLSLGNYPQAYSHVGLIHAAFAVSEPWDELL